MGLYAHTVSKKKTAQTQQAKKRQAKNNAGGYVFKLAPEKQLERFLVLGSDKPTYYASAKELTLDNASCIEACLDKDGVGTVELIASMSESGRIPKNDTAIFALAVACAHDDVETRKAALDAIPRVCRTGTHICQFVESVNQFRGWGKGLCNGVSNWYLNKDADKLAYQLVKYRNRHGWTHRDILRKAHPKTDDPAMQSLFRWVTHGSDNMKKLEGHRTVNGEKVPYKYKKVAKLPEFVSNFEALQAAKKNTKVIRLIEEHGFTHEMVPNQFKNDPKVWEALLPRMPLGAMIRNLGKMSSVGILGPLSEGGKLVAAKLGDARAIHKARLHPVSILNAFMTYRQGNGVRGSLRWDTNQQIIEALENAFYASFKTVQPSGKNMLLALDISGSMNTPISGLSISAAAASATMAMVTARSEPNYEIRGFATGKGGGWWGGTPEMQDLGITANTRLTDVYQNVRGFGATDCAQPMLWALKHKIPVDTFAVYTDSETYHGNIHPFQALKEYRQKMGRDARLVVVGMTSTGFSIADPSDPGMLDVVGFDTAAPDLIANFSKGSSAG